MMNGVSLRGGTDNEYSKGQQRGAAVVLNGVSHECPQESSLSRGRRRDSRQSRCIIGVAVVNKLVIAMITNEEGVLSGIYE